MVNRSKMEDWAELLELKRESGLSVKAFCDEYGVADHQFYYWQKRLREDHSQPGFVQLQADQPVGDNAGVLLDLANWSVRLERGFDDATLRRLLTVVRGGGC